MRLDGFGLFVEDMVTVVRFYRDTFEDVDAEYKKRYQKMHIQYLNLQQNRGGRKPVI